MIVLNKVSNKPRMKLNTNTDDTNNTDTTEILAIGKIKIPTFPYFFLKNISL